MIKKHLKSIIICAIAIVILAVGYFAILSPILNEEKEAQAPKLLKGEVLDEKSGKIYMYPMFEKDQIKEFTVVNENGQFGFYKDSDGQFYLTGFKGTAYDQNAFTGVASVVRMPLSIKRVTTDVSDLAKYGLVDCDYYSVTTQKGETYKVYVGDTAPTGGGYYARLEGRDAVYMLDNSTKYIKATAESFVTPILSLPTNQKDFAEKTTDFTLSVDGKPYIGVTMMSAQEKAAEASTTAYKMTVPENYVPSSSNYEHILQSFNEPMGTKVMAFGKQDSVMDETTLAKYGLDTPKYEIYYKYNGVDNYILASEKNEDGTYYAYSLMFNLICQVSDEKFDYLSWDFIDFIDKPMFQKNINDIAKIEIKGNGVDTSFDIEGSAQTLSVKAKGMDGALNADQLAGFKKMYVKLLCLGLEDYAEDTSKGEWLATFTVTTDGGKVYTYDFYSYSTRRAFFTINGVGEFYVLRDRVEKIVSDANLISSGGIATSEVS